MPAEHPFSSTYSPRLISSNEAWKDALARLEDGLGTRERILLVTGEAGTGKTALLLEATARWGEKARVVCVPNPTLSRLELLESAWDMAYDNRSNVVTVHIRRLREKIDRPFGRQALETVRGAGYRLRTDGG